jgi:amino acid transporter, AAT family
VVPKFNGTDFASFYIEIPVMLLMYIAWTIITRPNAIRPEERDSCDSSTPLIPDRGPHRRWWYGDLVDIETVDLVSDEHHEHEENEADRNEGDGPKSVLGKIYYWLV